MRKLNYDDIVFEEEGHKYYLKSDPTFKFKVSGSKIKKMIFKDDFDTFKVSERCSRSRYSDYYKMPAKEIRKLWALRGTAACEVGSLVHLEIENYIKYGLPTKHKLGLKVEEMVDELNEKGLTLITEQLVYSKDLSFSGAIDLLVINEETKEVEIWDWKTNREIKFSNSYQKPYKNGDWEIQDCNFSHYSLQLSSYAYILEREYGYKVTKINIIHLRDDEIRVIECDDYKELIGELLDDR